MAIDLDDILRIENGLFAAALGEIPFADALIRIIDTFGGAGGVVFDLNRTTGEISNWIGPGLEAGEQEYAERLNAINPRMRFSLRHAPGVIAYEGQFIDERAMDRHEFYAAIQRLSDMRYFVGTRIHDEGAMSTFHAVEFTSRHGHPEPDKIEAFRRLTESVGNAWRLARRRRAPDGGTADPWTPDHLPWAIFSLAADGHVLGTNRQGEEMVAAAWVLRIDDGRLVATSHKSYGKLRRLIAAALAGRLGAMEVETPEAIPFILQAVPVPAAARIDPSQPAVVVYVWDMLRAGTLRTSAVQRLFRLSDAEARVVELLSTGRSLSDVADALAISRNTARNHLQSVFAKTGTRRQSELLARVLGIVNG